MEIEDNLDTEITKFIQSDAKINQKKPGLWWASKGKSYPNLQKLIRKLLAIPASSSFIERIFSVAGIIGSKLRNKVLVSTMNSFITLRYDKVERRKLYRAFFINGRFCYLAISSHEPT